MSPTSSSRLSHHYTPTSFTSYLTHHLQIHHHPLHLHITTMSPSSSSSHCYHQPQYTPRSHLHLFCPTASAPYPLSPYPLRPRLPPNPMPGPHLHVAIFPCPKHVGGSDVWTSSYYLNDEQWWVGWHTTSPCRHWFSGQGHGPSLAMRSGAKTT